MSYPMVCRSYNSAHRHFICEQCFCVMVDDGVLEEDARQWPKYDFWANCCWCGARELNPGIVGVDDE